MTIQYDTLGGSVNVEPTGTVATGDLNTTVAIVGGVDMQAADPAVTAGESTSVTTGTDAETTFGADSELTRQAELAFLNGASVVYGVPVGTTQQTETFTSATSGTLANTPVMDPRVTSYDISATRVSDGTTLSVEMTDETPASGSVGADTIQVNHTTGEWATDQSAEYEITYYGGNFTSAIEAAVRTNPRYVAVCTESDTVIQTARDELTTAAGNIQFTRGLVGAGPGVTASDAASYEPVVDDWRVIETASARATNTNGAAVRTVGAIAGLLAGQPVDVTGSITYDNVIGLSSLAEPYSPQEAAQFERVTVLTDQFEVAEGITTATETAFSDIYKAEIIDLVVERLYQRVRNFRGGSNAQGARRRFRSRLKRGLSSLSAPNAQPPLLADGQGNRPFSIAVDQGTDETETVLTIGIDPAPIAKTVEVNLGVGPIQLNSVSV